MENTNPWIISSRKQKMYYDIGEWLVLGRLFISWLLTLKFIKIIQIIVVTLRKHRQKEHCKFDDSCWSNDTFCETDRRNPRKESVSTLI